MAKERLTKAPLFRIPPPPGKEKGSHWRLGFVGKGVGGIPSQQAPTTGGGGGGSSQIRWWGGGRGKADGTKFVGAKSSTLLFPANNNNNAILFLSSRLSPKTC